jgi:tetratricopeptide (TPR) repeat protein
MTGIARMLAPLAMMALLAAALAAPACAQATEPDQNQITQQLEALFAESKFAEAKAVCQQGYEAAADDETRAFYLRSLGTVYNKERDVARAAEILKQVMARFPATRQAALARIDLAKVHMYLAEIGQPLQENLAQALALLEAFLQERPQDDHAARALWWRGIAHERLGNRDAAFGDYQQAVDLYPAGEKADLCLTRMVEMHLEDGRLEEVIAAGRRYLELYAEKETGPVWYAMGMAYVRSGVYTGATGALDRAVASYEPNDPEWAHMAYKVAASLLATDDFELAHQYLGWVRENSLATANWQQAAAYLDAIAYYQAGDIGAAVPALEAVAATTTREADRWVAQSLLGSIAGSR